MNGLTGFCDLMRIYAKAPTETAVDGAGNCRTFVTPYCDLKKSLVHKNMPSSKKAVKGEKRAEIC